MHPFSSDLNLTQTQPLAQRARRELPRQRSELRRQHGQAHGRPVLHPAASLERDERHGPWIEVTLPADAGAPRRARAAVRAAGRALADGAVEVGTLLTSELVTNAVVHPPARDGDFVELRVAVDGLMLRVEVGDGGPGFDPAHPRWRPQERGGRGLQLVDQLAGRWGVVHRGDRFVVWFELRRDD